MRSQINNFWKCMAIFQYVSTFYYWRHMTVYILSLVRGSVFFLYIVLCLIIICNSTEINHLTSYPQTSSSNNQEFIAISISFFFVMVSMVMGWYNMLWLTIKSMWNRATNASVNSSCAHPPPGQLRIVCQGLHKLVEVFSILCISSLLIKAQLSLSIARSGTINVNRRTHSS